MSMMTSIDEPTLFDLVPQILPDDSPRVRKADPVESHLAADSITTTGVKDSQQHVYLDLIGHGLSASWEVERRAQDRWSPSRIRTALKELEEAGRVTRRHLAGVTPLGRPCAMFEAVQS